MTKFKVSNKVKVIGTGIGIFLTIAGIILVILAQTGAFKGGKHGHTSDWIGVAFMILGLIALIFLAVVGTIKSGKDLAVDVNDHRQHDFDHVLNTYYRVVADGGDGRAYIEKHYGEAVIKRVFKHLDVLQKKGQEKAEDVDAKNFAAMAMYGRNKTVQHIDTSASETAKEIFTDNHNG